MRFFAGLGAIFLAIVPGWGTPQATSTHAGSHRVTRPAEPVLPPVALPDEAGEYAVLYTTSGNIVCRLFEKDAPKAVANFVGLAKGTKAWTDPATGKLVHRPLYSGTIFHRVIPDFMIQGGDPVGTGSGSPGYTFTDEVDTDRVFDHAGLLAMANSGPDTNGSQFFITVAPTAWLNHKHTIFGEVVSGQEVADAISKVDRNSDDLPNTPVKLIRVVIRRVPAPAAAGSSKPVKP